MPFAQYLWDALNGLVGTVGAFKDHDIPEIENTDLNPTASLSSAHLPTTDLPIKECSKVAPRIKSQHPDTVRYSKSMYNSIGEVATTELSNLDSNNNTDLKIRKNEPQQEKSYVLKEKNFPNFNAEEFSAKDQEIAALKTLLDDRESEIRRLAGSEREAKRGLIREKNDLAHAKAKIERKAGRIEAENGRLASEREKVETRAVRAEGCARGLQDQLKATRTRAENWQNLYQQAVEEARDKVLSAYALPSAQIPTEDQQTTTTNTNISAEEQRLSVLVENLRKENSELLEKVEHQKTELETWEDDWEHSNKDLKDWEQGLLRWCEQEKQIAIETERANGRATKGKEAREQDIRRKYEEEKQQALAVEREICRVQREAQECSLRAQFAKKLKDNINREVQRLRRRGSTERKKQMKVKKGGIKSVVNQAVSHAVKAERSLLQGQFRAHFETEVARYKIQLESEHAIAQTQSGAHNNTNPIDQVLFNEEIEKRDGEINSQKKNLTDALDAKRELEATLNLTKAENERLSKAVIAYESQNSLANKTNTEAQISLMARELSRALKLLNEISILGLDEKHRYLLNELVLANKVVGDIRTAVEDESVVVDYDAFQQGLERVMESSDPFDALDPRERPALHAQLSETYGIVGGLSNILAGERGDRTKWDILERIYRDDVKGKGKEGAVVGSGVASRSSLGGNGGVGAASLPQATGNSSSTSDPNNNVHTSYNNTSTINSTPNPTANPSLTTPNTTAGGSQSEPEYIDSATANANMGTSDAFDPDTFNPKDIDWSDPLFQNLKFPD